VYADPKSPDTVYVLNTGAFRSVDGGKTFNLLPARHGDHHGLWIDPTNPNRIANANDGGASISTDGGKNWTTQHNQPTAQFYHVAVDNAFPYHIYGAQQDNSNVGIASRSDSGVIGRENWFEAGGGECGFVVPDPRDWHIIYSNNEGFINRFDKNKQEVQDVSPMPIDNAGHGAVDLTHRFQWVSPLMLSPHNPDVLYTAGECVFKSTDDGQSWTQISGDLTRNDKSKQQPSGGPLTNDITSVEYYDTVFALAESPVNKGTLWAGTDDGLLHVKDDDLVVATHGRSFWVLDNLTPLRQVNAQSASDVILYQPQTALRLHYPEEFDKRQPVGDNPPPGAMIDYYLKVAPKEEVSLDILDSSGKIVRHLSSKEKKEGEQPPEWPDRVERVKTIPANEGMNRFAWDLRYDDPIQIPGAFYSSTGPKGPLALPGDYQVKLTVGGKSQTGPLHLV